jgi:hypothetical protein
MARVSAFEVVAFRSSRALPRTLAKPSFPVAAVAAVAAGVAETGEAPARAVMGVMAGIIFLRP